MKDELQIKLKALLSVALAFLFVYTICLVGVYLFTKELNGFIALVSTLTILGSYFVVSVYDHMVQMNLEELDKVRKMRKEIEDYFNKFEE